MDYEWVDHPGRHCRNVDPNVFFGAKGSNSDAELAKSYCHGCPVKDECLEYAIEDASLHGVWGGCTFQERKDIRRQRGIVSRMARHGDGLPRTGSRGPAPKGCGTNAGANLHRIRGEKPCEDCLAAAAQYHREWRKRKGVA